MHVVEEGSMLGRVQQCVATPYTESRDKLGILAWHNMF